MKVSDLFPSRFSSGQDLDGKPHVVSIQRVRGEDVYSPEERKEMRVFVLEVKEFSRPFILRKTLAEQIAAALGEEEVERWAGKRVELYPVSVSVGGARKTGVRARAAQQPQAAPADAPSKAPAQPAASAPAVTKNDQGEITVGEQTFPVTIGEKDYMTFYNFARAIGMDPNEAKKLVASSQNNAQAAYSVARNRYASGQAKNIP